MPSITIDLSDEEKSVLEKRAKKNLMPLKEQIEDIVRRSAVSSQLKSIPTDEKVDDRLVTIFSRAKRGKSGKRKPKAELR